MNVALPNPRLRAAVVLFSLVLAVWLGYFGIRNALAAQALGSDTRQGYERAVQLEPRDSRNWYLLGRFYLYDFEEPDPARAVLALRQAVELDRFSSEAWLDLAAAYEVTADPGRARQAYLSAMRVYPQSADVNWSYGNFLLREGDQQQGLPLLHKAVELDPTRSAEAFSRALRVQPDANLLLDQAVPASTAVYLPILHALSDAGDLDNAEMVWERLVKLQQKVPMSEMIKFFDGLSRKGRLEEAKRRWPQAVSIMQNAPPPDPAGSLVWDGGFESGYLGMGFAWHFVPITPYVQISLDRSEKHSGEQSLRILFNGRQNLSFEDGCQNIAPESGQLYLLSAWIRTEALSSSEGVRLEIVAYGVAGYTSAVTEEVHGTQPWKQLQLPWIAPQGASYGMVCVKRFMSDSAGSDIQGAAWIDDVALTPVDQATAKP